MGSGPYYTARTRFFLNMRLSLDVRQCWAYYLYKISENYNYGQKTLKMPLNGCFLPFVIPQDFFQKSDSVTFVPSLCPNFMQKARKN